MPDRFHKFTDEELETLRWALMDHIGVSEDHWTNPEMGPRTHELLDEIEHLQLQRKHAAARQMVLA